MEHRQLTAPGGRVHYWVEPAAPGADCIVWVHGLTADHTMFEKQVEYFSGKVTQILPDLPLHGLSRPYQGFTYRDTAEILHKILQIEQISAAFFVGMSLGGYPCQHFAVRWPEKVRGFVALDTTPLGLDYYSRSDLWWLERAAPMAGWFPAGLLRWSMARSISRTEYACQSMMRMLAPLSKADIVAQMDAAYGQFVRENRDAAFSFPVLILVGDRDSTGKVKAYCKAWAEKTGYPLHWVKNARHYSNGDNPEQVNREIAAFLQECKQKEGETHAAL